jgi:hypothetical protein
LYTVWKSSLSFVNIYSQKSIDIRRLVSGHISKTIDFYLGMLNFRSEFNFLKIRLIGIKKMVKCSNLSRVTQSLLELASLMDSHFSEWGLICSWTDETIAQFNKDIRVMFGSELYPLIKKNFLFQFWMTGSLIHL